MIRSPSEYYIRYLITHQYLRNLQDLELDDGHEEVELEWLDPNEIFSHLSILRLDGIDIKYIQLVASEMCPMPMPFEPINNTHYATNKFLKRLKIYDLWHITPAVKEAQLILTDIFLRDKLEPLLLSTISRRTIAKRLRKYTSIILTSEGINAYAHYFWNRNLLTQYEWMTYLKSKPNRNSHRQSLVTSPDLASQHLPWVIGIGGPPRVFNSAEAASRVGQIAYKHALELEHEPASAEVAHALRNYMVTIEKADQVIRRSDVALRDVLSHFQKFRMKVDSAKVVSAKQLTDGNYSKSGEGTDTDEDF